MERTHPWLSFPGSEILIHRLVVELEHFQNLKKTFRSSWGLSRMALRLAWAYHMSYIGMFFLNIQDTSIYTFFSVPAYLGRWISINCRSEWFSLISMSSNHAQSICMMILHMYTSCDFFSDSQSWKSCVLLKISSKKVEIFWRYHTWIIHWLVQKKKRVYGGILYIKKNIPIW